MPEHKRSSLDVVVDILRISGSKTAIMYGANLSYAQTQKYLEMLLKREFLKAGNDKNGRARYSATEKGRRLLALVKGIEAFMDGGNGRNTARLLDTLNETLEEGPHYQEPSARVAPWPAAEAPPTLPHGPL